MNPDQTNLQELVTALANIQDDDGNPLMSHEFMGLADYGLSHGDLPETLMKMPAEAFMQVFQAMGGLPRLLLYADRNPAAFYKLFARLLVQTSGPLVPKQGDANYVNEFPDWAKTPSRLAYSAVPPTSASDDGMEGADEDGG